MYKIETHLQTYKQAYSYQNGERGRERGKLGLSDSQTQDPVYKIPILYIELYELLV